MTYIVINSHGRNSEHTNLKDAKRAALRGTGSKKAFLCDWFPVDVRDGDTYTTVQAALVWSTLADSRYDDGSKAVAEIQRR